MAPIKALPVLELTDKASSAHSRELRFIGRYGLA